MTYRYEDRWVDYKVTNIFRQTQMEMMNEFIEKMAPYTIKWLDIENYRNSHTMEQTMHLFTYTFGRRLSYNKRLPLDQILSHPEIQWSWDIVTLHPQVTWDIVQQHPQFPWSYKFLSRNPTITWEVVQQHYLRPWNHRKMVSHNPNITWEHIRQHERFYRERLVDFYQLFPRNPNFTFALFQQVRLFAMNHVSANSNITWEQINSHPKYEWDYQSFVTYNDNATAEIVKEIYQRTNGTIDCLARFEKHNPNLSFQRAFELKHKYNEYELLVRCSYKSENKYFDRQLQLQEKLHSELLFTYFHPCRYHVFKQHQHG